MTDYAREPGQFLNKLNNETVQAMQWKRWNHYAIQKFLNNDDEEGNVCSYSFDKDGNMQLCTLEGSLWVWPMDWVIKSSTGFSPCPPQIFDQICEVIE